MIVFLNGQFVPEEQALVSVFDRSFLYGDGLFETMLIANATPFRWSQHMARLQAGAGFLGIRLPLDPGELLHQVTRLIHLNQATQALLRLTLSRGVGPRGYCPRGADAPVLVMTLHDCGELGSGQLLDWQLRTSEFRLPASQSLAQFKTCNKLPQILARSHAAQAAADEALLPNTDGFIVEGASSNLFWIDQGTVHTPPLVSGVLSGVTRSAIFELCGELGLKFQEGNVTGSRLLEAEGVFLSLSSIGVVQGASLDGIRLRQSRLTRQLHQAYWELVRRETRKGK